jgi:hypothetical protein
MSGTKRRPLDCSRKPTFDTETIAEFARLEAVHDRLQDGDAFQKADYALHSRLGLGEERICSQVSIFDRNEQHSRPGSLQALRSNASAIDNGDYQLTRLEVELSIAEERLYLLNVMYALAGAAPIDKPPIH